MILGRERPSSARNEPLPSPNVEVVIGRDEAQRTFDAADVQAALSVVPGICEVFVGPNEGQVATSAAQDVVRLVLNSDADESVVAASVNRILRMQFGLALDGGSIEVSTTSTPRPVENAPRLCVVESCDDDVDVSAVDVSAVVVPLEGDLASFLGRFGAVGDGSGDFHDDVVTSAARHPSRGQVFSSSVGSPTDVSAVPERSEVEVDARARLAIAHLTLAADGLGMRASVCLSQGGSEFMGQALGSTTSSGVNRSVAEATLGAISHAINHREHLELEAVVITNVNAERVAIVQVVRFPAGGSERLTGASEVRDDVRQAVIRATLDAVNRRLSEHLNV
jgi:hypothetical protein